MMLDPQSLSRSAQVARALFSGPLEQELNAADGKLGDGDTGVTLRRVFDRVAQAAEAPADTLGAAFLACARAGAGATGSSLGTLCAIALMDAGKATQGEAAVEWSRLGSMLQSALEAMMKRGRANLGDKTILDTLHAIAEATAGLTDLDQIKPTALDAAQAALEAFRSQPCKMGRARMFGEKSIGIDDPGMLALTRLVQALCSPEGGTGIQAQTGPNAAEDS